MACWMRGTHQRVPRCHGLERCRDKGFGGTNRWLGVIADNPVNIARVLEKQAAS